MTERFKKYLEQEFRAIPPTKGAMDFRKATLVRLEEYAQDARIKGMTDEDAIFNLAIDSLGDFKSTLIKFNDELSERPKRNNRRLFLTLAICFTIVFVIGLYLVTSLLGLIPWNTSWLILVASIFTAIIGAFTMVGLNVAKRKAYTLPRVLLALSEVLASTFIFLVLLMTTDLPNVWFTFLVMVMLIIVSDVAVAFLTKSKLAILESILAFVVISVLLFVMLGISQVMPWHPGWLLPALSVMISLSLVITLFVHHINKKKGPRVKKSAVKPTEVDDKYYTEW